MSTTTQPPARPARRSWHVYIEGVKLQSVKGWDTTTGAVIAAARQHAGAYWLDHQAPATISANHAHVRLTNGDHLTVRRHGVAEEAV